ncbi:MAG TPA: ATP-binding protein [Xanthomonadales bacterium]|nr:ATP-binding protein [Xanthomonadales bacterium]
MKPILPKMNSLLGKILLALLASTLLALLLVSTIQRSSFKRGFSDFLQQQEEVQLSYLVPELQDWYGSRGSWDALRGDTRRWLRLLARARPEGITPPEDAQLEVETSPPPIRPRKSLRQEDERGDKVAEPGKDRRDNKRPPDELRRLWRRMFLLDAGYDWVAGAPVSQAKPAGMQAVVIDDVTVGWVGFVPAAQPVAPEARRFMTFQRNTLLVSAAIALLFSALLGFLLARHLTRPVVALRDSVQSLTAGDFSVRTQAAGNDEIASLGRHVNRLAETLQANESARRRWTADIAHELRTPIAILQAEIEAARDGVRPDWNKTLTSLHEEISHLAVLVDNLQALALADAGALNLQLADTDLAMLLQQVVDGLGGRLSQAGLQLETEAPDQLIIPAEAQRVRQLLLNLLENACRYTDAGGKVRVELKAHAGGARLVVEDTAPGLQAGQLEKLFDRFYRAESSRGRATGGSGLGLSICREIVLAHGGQISAGPSDLGGLAIVVTLPGKI